MRYLKGNKIFALIAALNIPSVFWMFNGTIGLIGLINLAVFLIWTALYFLSVYSISGGGE